MSKKVAKMAVYSKFVYCVKLHYFNESFVDSEWLLHRIIVKEMIQMKKLILFTITLLLVVLTLYACSDEQEENKTDLEEPGNGVLDSENESNENEVDPISIGKIENYEGMEITDWIDEHTVVLAKENQEFEKMSLLENAEFYPRSIYVYNLDTKEFKTIKAQKDMFLGGATLSPDKKHLLYYENSIGDIAYYMMSLGEGEKTLVTEDIIGSVYTAEWTDENHVIGASYAGGAVMADTEGNVTPIAELQEEQLFNVHKMQEKIYYITTENPSFQVYKMDWNTKEKKKLPLENAERITLSPDGKQLLVTQTTGNTKRLIIADTDGNIQSIIAEGSDVTGASWSPNQQMIVYQSSSIINGEEKSGLHLYEVTSDESIQIVQDIGNVKTKWSPSGKKISVVELDGKIYNSSIISID